MDTYMVDQLKRRWPADWTKLHVYFVPDPTEIKPLIDAYQSIIEDLECVSPQPDQWLHATLMVIDGIPARDVTEQQIADLTQRLEQAMADLPVFTVTCGPAVAGRSTIALDLTPDRGFAELRTRATTAAAHVFDADAARYSNGRPHITLGYARGEGDSGIIQTKLLHATDMRVPLTVDAVRLVDVTADMDRLQFRWNEVAVLPLKS
ncbi:2'-5' RNA ligase family protein [Nocardia sp. NPDC060256]|uniref:2'-5' RNA ligase family protein n=1 Tax=unclassified Nocardia TaxID=2637762 RepID=UPI00364F3BC2